MELFETITIKSLVMYSIKGLQDRLYFLDAIIEACDNPEVIDKLLGLGAAYNAQFAELSQWFAKYYSVDES